MMGQITVYRTAIYALAVVAPFFVTVFFSKLNSAPLGILYSFPLLVALYILNTNKLTFDKNQTLFALAFFGPVFCTSFIGLFYASTSSPLGLNYQPYLSESVGRYINLVAVFSFFAVVCSVFNSLKAKGSKQQFISNIAWFYFYALWVIALFGFWQLLSHYIAAIPFPFETRTSVHGVQDISSVGGLVRLTSIANEPSYFAPLLLDAIILSLLLLSARNAKIMIVLLVILLVLTFSGGGYLNVVVITSGLTLALILRSVTVFKASPLIVFYFFILCLVAAAILTAMYYVGVISLIADRLPHILDINQHSRAYMVLMPFKWAYESGPINFLFGHGVKSYALLGQIFIIPSNNEAVHITSNNAFTDIFWELGLVGLIAIVGFFCWIIVSCVTAKTMYKEHWVALLIMLHLVGSSLYRADFASPRFFILIILALFLLHLAKIKYSPSKTAKCVEP